MASTDFGCKGLKYSWWVQSLYGEGRHGVNGKRQCPLDGGMPHRRGIRGGKKIRGSCTRKVRTRELWGGSIKRNQKFSQNEALKSRMERKDRFFCPKYL